MRPPTLLFAFPALVAIIACGKQPLDVRSPAPAPAPEIEVVVGDPLSQPVALAVVPPAKERPPEPTAPPVEPEPPLEPEALPKAWTAPSIPGLSFADALRKARGARDAFGHLVPPATNAKEASMKTWFGQAQTFVDQASRMYAASFHAPDAPREGRIDAIAEAAELDMTMARSLDEAGLGSMPVAWRADPAVMSTFEDIAIGPTRRWRDEARVLARQCIDTARDSGVITDAARRCATLRTGTPPKPKRGPDPAPGCACSPGDPLCSASLGGWCGTTH
ncbi:MAG: hypothetical protein QOI41_466 [Myxococcales bacterium]|nr:hypothetical protein [Myxococcales bacterium]